MRVPIVVQSVNPVVQSVAGSGDRVTIDTLQKRAAEGLFRILRANRLLSPRPLYAKGVPNLNGTEIV